MMRSNERVVIFKSENVNYPGPEGYSPSRQYPEYPFGDLSHGGEIYEAVRETFHLMGLDDANFGSPGWNPLRAIVRPGDRVVVKPNLVQDFNESGHTTDCLITHASVLRPIIDYVHIALKGTGQIIVADSPHGNANFEIIRELTGLNALYNYYAQKRVEIEIRDLRRYEYGFGRHGFIEKRKTVSRDPEGYVEIDLGRDSAFNDLPHKENLYGADFDRREVRRYHNQDANKYLVARTYLCADVIINVPKLKTHRKIGTTLNLKSLIGINGDKNYLPHFRIFDPAHGGDEYPNLLNKFESLKRWAKRRITDMLLGDNDFKNVKTYKFIRSLYKAGKAAGPRRKTVPIASGDWYGNETVYRTVYDLSQILFRADRSGTIHSNPQRRFFSVIDGIVAGEKEGPMEPTPKSCGVILCGFNPVAVDLVATRLMGFDPRRMPLFSNLSRLPSDHALRDIPVDCIDLISNVGAWNHDFFSSDRAYLSFIPPNGWLGHIEIAECKSESD
jgi:uncharacterized protein (DUF362 family)